MKRKLLCIPVLIAVLCSLLSVTAPGAELSRYDTIGGGTLHSAVIKSDGSLWTWGGNWGGALGSGVELFQSAVSPMKIADDVVSVSLGEWHTVFIKKDQSLWAIGDNTSGQLGIGNKESKSSPVKIMDDVSYVSAGGCYTAILKNDGSLWVCGRSLEVSILSPQKIMDGVLAVSTGGEHTAAIKNDRSLWMWGRNEIGQLGTGDTEDRVAPVKVMDDVLAVSIGTSNSAAIKTDGSLWVWGSSKYGKLGNGGTENSAVPIKLMDDVLTVSMGGNHNAAIKKDGSLWMWGYNWNGELGNASKKNSNVPIKVMDNVAAVDLGGSHALAIRDDGSLWTWGANRVKQASSAYEEVALTTPTKFMDNVKIPDTNQSHTASEPMVSTVRTSFGAAVSAWAVDEIESAYEIFLIPETLMDTDLREKVTRSEFAAIAVQLYEALTGEYIEASRECGFSDILGDVNEAAIRRAYELGITTGTSATKYEPLSTINREQLATMLYRVIKKSLYPGWTQETDSETAIDLTGVKKFEDDADISEWAKQAVYFLSSNGFVNGVSETRFAPKNVNLTQEASGYANATREQALIIAKRILLNIQVKY